MLHFKGTKKINSIQEIYIQMWFFIDEQELFYINYSNFQQKIF